MSNENQSSTYENEILALNEKDLVKLNAPVDEKAEHAERLAVQAEKDKTELVNAGLDESLITKLPGCSATLRKYQADWVSEYRVQKEAQQRWKEESPIAYDLRDDLITHFSFAFRKDDSLLKLVRQVREGNSRTNMVQDLLDLSTIGEKHKGLLEGINMDLNLLTKASTMSQTMAHLLAQVNSTDGGSQIKLKRDKAYTMVTQIMREICEVGKYVFRKDKEHHDKYLSSD